MIGEIDENKIEKLIDVEYFKNIEETVVFYFSPCNKSQEVTIKIVKDIKIYGKSEGDFGIYLCINKKDEKNVIELL